ncbi:MAG: DUF4272 domain-containing protein [Ruminococcus sp.]|uniref:DUF4272 domain-containing protein n=1 Tax=Ruminococcus sp. TaxID=41978 RepID=UPI001B2EE9DF|nr:DUF4272 domain-containing protein [Ruminococcus sp.]MBO7474834.1 DUF4272 domain-containing protein [Ruminococcus sp.]
MAPAERKANSEKIIAAKGIGINPGLPHTEPASQIKLRSLDEVCRRAIAALLSTQVGFGRSEQNDEDVNYFVGLMDYFGVKDCLNAKERRLVDGSYTQQDVIDVVWEYESYWTLVWALGLVDDITDAENICDCPQAVRFVSQSGSYEEFREKCSLRSADEIMDMLDLYYRYHWAVVQHESIDTKCPIGGLNTDAVSERRRGLEWLVCDTADWNDISLDT